MILELIQTLKPSEKRYIRLELEQSKNKNLILLFDASCKTMSNKILDESCKNYSFHNILPTVKSQLYKFILRRLRGYHEKMNVDAYLRNTAIEIDILAKKKLFTQAHKKIKAAKIKAYDFERFTYLLELLNYEMVILWEVQSPKEYTPELKKIKEEIDQVTRMHDIYIAHKQDYFALSSLNFDLVNTQLYLETNKIPEIRSGRYFFLLNRINLSLQHHKFELALACTDQLMDLMAVSLHEFKQNTSQFIDIMFYCCQAAIINMHHHKTKFFFRELQGIKPDSVNNTHKLKERLAYIHLLSIKVYENETMHFEQTMNYYESRKNNLDKLIIQKGYDLLTGILIEKKDFKKANFYNNIMLSEAKRNLNKSLLKKALIKEIIIAYYMDKLTLMDYRLSSFWKAKSKYQLSDDEMNLLRGFYKVQNKKTADLIMTNLAQVYF